MAHLTTKRYNYLVPLVYKGTFLVIKTENHLTNSNFGGKKQVSFPGVKSNLVECLFKAFCEKIAKGKVQLTRLTKAWRKHRNSSTGQSLGPTEVQVGYFPFFISNFNLSLCKIK